ncbi:MAG TPA: D-2-hydroxyacid dehydrogenase [Vicinamibacterales bacterium]|nr:D-2-hydroxyacid dehydrogenase [Vicinamibacterales bacterium]
MRILLAIYSDILTWNIPDAYVERLRREFPHHEFVQAHDAAETVMLAADADIAFSSLIDRAALASARRLNWIHSPAAGVGSLLFPEMKARPIVVTNSRGTHAEAMAEHVIGMIIAIFRKFPEAFAHQAAHRWGHDAMTSGEPCRLVRGSVAGVVGPGAIGTAVGRLLTALGARVEAIRRRPALGVPDGAAAVFAPADLHERLPHWDIVVLAAPLTAETRGMFGAAELARMKREAILVNVGRGKLVKEADLIDALQRRAIRAAALDVVEHEPLDPQSALWDLPNVVITPHTSSLRADYWDIAVGLFAENLRRFDRGEPLLNVVDKEAGY